MPSRSQRCNPEIWRAQLQEIQHKPAYEELPSEITTATNVRAPTMTLCLQLTPYARLHGGMQGTLSLGDCGCNKGFRYLNVYTGPMWKWGTPNNCPAAARYQRIPAENTPVQWTYAAGGLALEDSRQGCRSPTATILYVSIARSDHRSTVRGAYDRSHTIMLSWP